MPRGKRDGNEVALSWRFSLRVLNQDDNAANFEE